MKTFWDERYATEEFVYGTAPNEFLSASLAEIRPGKLLLPGEGEGRNAVHAASLGWDVTAFDQSEVAMRKARLLMKDKGLSFRYDVAGLEDFKFAEEAYDAIGLVFFHAPPPQRQYLHQQVEHALKPGGLVILEAFHTSQLGKETGGPRDPAMLYDKPVILEDFQGFIHHLLEVTSTELQEGLYHRGEARVLRYTGMKNRN